MNDENCRDFLCKEKIHSSSDWKNAALRTKKTLQNLDTIIKNCF